MYQHNIIHLTLVNDTYLVLHTLPNVTGHRQPMMLKNASISTHHLSRVIFVLPKLKKREGNLMMPLLQ
jgi:hypothetical protein